MQLRIKILIVSLILPLTIMIVGLAGGCTSSTLPQRITSEQRALLQRTRIDVTIGVEDYEAPVYSEDLTKVLLKTHLFTRVDHLTNFTTPPDFVARVEERIYGSAVIPIFTGLSLGIIPTTVDERHGYSFSLGRPGTEAPRIPIRFVYKGPTTLGWWAVFLNLSPNRTMRDIDGHPRFIESFAWEIATKRDEIESLKASSALQPAATTPLKGLPSKSDIRSRSPSERGWFLLLTIAKPQKNSFQPQPQPLILFRIPAIHRLLPRHPCPYRHPVRHPVRHSC
jgi:hypothetical protein